jgi:hypothetical protein
LENTAYWRAAPAGHSVIDWLRRNAPPTDEILINYEDVPLVFHLPNPIREESLPRGSYDYSRNRCPLLEAVPDRGFLLTKDAFPPFVHSPSRPARCRKSLPILRLALNLGWHRDCHSPLGSRGAFRLRTRRLPFSAMLANLNTEPDSLSTNTLWNERSSRR